MQRIAGGMTHGVLSMDSFAFGLSAADAGAVPDRPFAEVRKDLSDLKSAGSTPAPGTGLDLGVATGIGSVPQFAAPPVAPPAPPMEVSDLVPASGAHFLRAPVGWDGDFHQAPRRQYIVVLQGRIEARATDGTRFEIGPGDVVLLEDTWGVGHASRVVGDEDWLALVVVLD